MISEKEQLKLDKAAEKEHELLLAHVNSMMRTDAGCEVMWHLLSACNVYGNTFTGNSQGAFLEGRRSIGLEIIDLFEGADLKLYPNLLLKMRDKK